jgi:hypothetical protein
MMSLVRAQLGEPQQSSLLTTLFSFLGSMSIVGEIRKIRVLYFEVINVEKKSYKN